MYPTKNTIPEKVRIQIGGMLQIHLSNSIDLVSQAKQAHWNVKGPDFISLHGLFDKVAEQSEEYIDLIAERIVQLGGVAEGTIKIAATRTLLPDYSLNISSGHDHVKALAHTLASYGEGIRNAIGNADELGDRDTADLLTQISREVDKNLWFVEAHNQSPR
ncbi:MAG: DNA starvation/stationary phase protection protein Dps [Cryobacterium sp.]|nr:DNA starvation/stationary phase protection protein Dps [Oligoflexia bacterium]